MHSDFKISKISKFENCQDVLWFIKISRLSKCKISQILLRFQDAGPIFENVSPFLDTTIVHNLISAVCWPHPSPYFTISKFSMIFSENKIWKRCLGFHGCGSKLAPSIRCLSWFHFREPSAQGQKSSLPHTRSSLNRLKFCSNISNIGRLFCCWWYNRIIWVRVLWM